MQPRNASRSTAVSRPWGAVGVVATLVVGLVAALEAPAAAVNEECVTSPVAGTTCSYTDFENQAIFQVPAGVRSVRVQLTGGDGGDVPAETPAAGGVGGRTTTTLSGLQPGENLFVYVGEAGHSGSCGGDSPGDSSGGLSGGTKTGGDGGETEDYCYGGGGGGASLLVRGGSGPTDGEVLAAAGGGGGAAQGYRGGRGGGSATGPGDGAGPGNGEGGAIDGRIGEDGADSGGPEQYGSGGGGSGYPRSGSGGTTAGGGGGGGCGFPGPCPDDYGDSVAGFHEAANGSVIISFGGNNQGPKGPGNGQPPPAVPTDPNPNGGSHPSSNDPNPNTNPADPKPLPGMPANTDTALCKPEKKICTVRVSGPDSSFRIDAEDGTQTAVLFASMNGNWRPASVEASGRPNCPDYAERNSDWVQFGFFQPERGKTWHKTGYMTQRQKMTKAAASAMAQKLQVCFAAPYTFPTRPGYRLGTQGPDRVGVLAECGTLRGRNGRPVPCVAAREILKVKRGWVVRLTFTIPANAKDPKALG